MQIAKSTSSSKRKCNTIIRIPKQNQLKSKEAGPQNPINSKFSKN